MLNESIRAPLSRLENKIKSDAGDGIHGMLTDLGFAIFNLYAEKGTKGILNAEKNSK